MTDTPLHEELITKFILEEILDDLETLGTSDDLLADGMVDSLGMVRLVAFLEDELAIVVPPEDFTIENFLTVNHISNYLTGRMG